MTEVAHENGSDAPNFVTVGDGPETPNELNEVQ